MLLGIIVLDCTSKKSEEEKTPTNQTTIQTLTEDETTAEGNTDFSSKSFSSRFLFEQNFAQNNITEIMGGDNFSGEYETYEYLPNIGFSAGKRIIYNGTILLLNYSIPNSALAVLNKEELRLLRNTIYAKHGMVFQSDDISNHFRQFGWYAPKSRNIDALLTDIDKENIENIQLFENAEPNFKVTKSDLASDGSYYPMVGVPSDCSELRINDNNTISKRQFPWNEDNWKGTYRIENGFLVVFVTEQGVSEYYSELVNWQWPDNTTYNDGIIEFNPPIKMVFPVSDQIYLSEEYGNEEYGDISYRRIGSEKWF